ncbi:hypothetical protein, partial [Levilactobacillus spicheri]
FWRPVWVSQGFRIVPTTTSLLAGVQRLVSSTFKQTKNGSTTPVINPERLSRLVQDQSAVGPR